MRSKLLLLVAALLLGGCAPTARQAFGPELARARKNNIPVLVYALGVPGQIAVATGKIATPVYVQFVVTASTPIQSVRFILGGYTVRGHPARNRHGWPLVLVLIGHGPFLPDKNYEVNSFHAVPAGFPGAGVVCIRLERLSVIYPGGRRQAYAGRRVMPLLLASLRRGCRNQGLEVKQMSN